jgi:hypothetical protein
MPRRRNGTADKEALHSRREKVVAVDHVATVVMRNRRRDDSRWHGGFGHAISGEIARGLFG